MTFYVFVRCCTRFLEHWRPAPTTLFHARGRHFATELSLWPGQSCGTVCRRQFVTRTVYSLLRLIIGSDRRSETKQGKGADRAYVTYSDLQQSKEQCQIAVDSQCNAL